MLCLVISAVDGDTLRVRCPLWPGVVAEENVRVRGLDTPELRGKCEEEKAMAQQAKRLAEDLDKVELTNISRDKYGRILADVYFERDGQKLSWAEFMVAMELGRPYEGGKRQPWC